MARLVQVIGVTHNPSLPRALQAADAELALRDAASDYSSLRDQLARAKPDVLVVIGSDHLNQWFMNNMPAFMIGKAPKTAGPFPREVRVFGLSPYSARVDVDTATGLLAAGSGLGVDFAFSDEFRIDHSFTVPLSFLRPEMDLPIVPIWTNVMAPPIPVAERFYAVGQALGSMIERLPSAKRVSVASSGHLAVEVGGPKPTTRPGDVEWDRRMMELIRTADVPTLLRESTWDRMILAGNVAPGFMNYILLLGLAGGQAPTSVGLRVPETNVSVPFMTWELDPGDAG